jgi:hypothetical protein
LWKASLGKLENKRRVFWKEKQLNCCGKLMEEPSYSQI